MAEDLSGLDTFPKLLLHHARVRPERPAIREKDLGIWQTWSWRRYADEVRSLACGLAAQGFTRGDHLALIGETIYSAPANYRYQAVKLYHKPQRPCVRKYHPNFRAQLRSWGEF